MIGDNRRPDWHSNLVPLQNDCKAVPTLHPANSGEPTCCYNPIFETVPATFIYAKIAVAWVRILYSSLIRNVTETRTLNIIFLAVFTRAVRGSYSEHCVSSLHPPTHVPHTKIYLHIFFIEVRATSPAHLILDLMVNMGNSKNNIKIGCIEVWWVDEHCMQESVNHRAL
jgi:hypothetical protein